MWEKDLERGMLIATSLMIINLLVGFIATLANATSMTASTTASIAFLEIGILLILGGCMMARQPLKDEDRLDKDGVPTSTWKMALIGRQMLFAAMLIFVLAIIIVTISVFVPF